MELGTGMGVTVMRGMFGKDDGQIQWYGIIATINMTREFWAWKVGESMAVQAQVCEDGLGRETA